jgi:hypothetical protein
MGEGASRRIWVRDPAVGHSAHTVPSPGFGRGAGIAEQIEEEKSAAQIVDQLRMVGEQRGPLLFIDRHLGKRSE